MGRRNRTYRAAWIAGEIARREQHRQRRYEQGERPWLDHDRREQLAYEARLRSRLFIGPKGRRRMRLGARRIGREYGRMFVDGLTRGIKNMSGAVAELKRSMSDASDSMSDASRMFERNAESIRRKIGHIHPDSGRR